MVIKLLRSYPKLNDDGTRKTDKHGQPIIVFVYRVTGTDEQLAEFERIQIAEKVKSYKDLQGYLWFTTTPVGIAGRLLVSKNGKLFVDTTAIDLAGSLIKQYGELGKEMARDLLAKGFVTEQAETPVVTTPTDLDDL